MAIDVCVRRAHLDRRDGGAAEEERNAIRAQRLHRGEGVLETKELPFEGER